MSIQNWETKKHFIESMPKAMGIAHSYSYYKRKFSTITGEFFGRSTASFIRLNITEFDLKESPDAIAYIY